MPTTREFALSQEPLEQVLPRVVREFQHACRAGLSPSLDAARDRIEAVHESIDSTLAKIANLLLLSGVAGTMVALFTVSSGLKAHHGATLSKQLLIDTYGDAFSAFAVAIVGVSLGAAAFVAGHIVRQRLERSSEALLAELSEFQLAHAIAAVKPDQQLAIEIKTSIGQLVATLSASTELTANSLGQLSANLGEKLAPLAKFDQLFQGVSGSVEQLSAFVKGHSNLLAMMGELREASEALRATAAALPSEYREHTSTTTRELHKFGADAEKAMMAINERIGELAAYVGELPKRTRSLLDDGLKEYETQAREAFQTYSSGLQRMTEESENGVRTVMRASSEEAKGLFEAPLQQLEERLGEHADGLDQVATRIAGRLKEIHVALADLEDQASRTAGGLRVANSGIAVAETSPPAYFDTGEPASARVPRRRALIATAAAAAVAVIAAGGYFAIHVAAEGEHEPGEGGQLRAGGTRRGPELVSTAPGSFAVVTSAGGAMTTLAAGAAFGETRSTLVAIGQDCVVLQASTGKLRTQCVTQSRPDAGGKEQPSRSGAQLAPRTLRDLIRLRYGTERRPERLALLRSLLEQHPPCAAESQLVASELVRVWFDPDPMVATMAMSGFLPNAGAAKREACTPVPDAGKALLSALSYGPAELADLALAVAEGGYCNAIPWAMAIDIAERGVAEDKRLISLATACGRSGLTRRIKLKACERRGAPARVCRTRFPTVVKPAAQVGGPREAPRPEATAKDAVAGSRPKPPGPAPIRLPPHPVAISPEAAQ